MIIEKGTILKSRPDLEVFTTKDYADNELVECNVIGENEPVYAFEARYVLHGEEVYR